MQIQFDFRGKDAGASVSLPGGENECIAARPRVLVVDYGGSDGGSVYESMVADSLAAAFDVSRYSLKGKGRRRQPVEYLSASIRLGKLGRVFCRPRNFALSVKTFDAAFFDDRQTASTIVIVHHLQGGQPVEKSLREAVYAGVQNRILRKLLRVSAVVVVSEYWRQHLEVAGFRNVRKIYNAFPIEEFEFSKEEINSFKSRHGLEDKPIIYLGNSKRGGGVDWAYDALKDLNVHLVASGIPATAGSTVRCLSLGYRDYLRLLKSSSLAVVMSQFAEGWCRTAHEAMLCGTPVLGSGQGGMQELLDGGRQVICEDFRSLRAAVDGLLFSADTKVRLGQTGYEYASQFTYRKFQAQWLELAGRLCQLA